MRIERQHEHLRFVNALLAFIGPRAANRRTAGREAECLRSDFGAGAEISGPAVIGQVDATTLLPPGSSARVDEYGNLMITV